MDLAERTDLDWLHHRQYVAPLETRLRELVGLVSWTMLVIALR
jgi:hypothetical protein